MWGGAFSSGFSQSSLDASAKVRDTLTGTDADLLFILACMYRHAVALRMSTEQEEGKKGRLWAARGAVVLFLLINCLGLFAFELMWSDTTGKLLRCTYMDGTVCDNLADSTCRDDCYRSRDDCGGLKSCENVWAWGLSNCGGPYPVFAMLLVIVVSAVFGGGALGCCPCTEKDDDDQKDASGATDLER